jgi:hypothetical protein
MQNNIFLKKYEKMFGTHCVAWLRKKGLKRAILGQTQAKLKRGIFVLA